MKSQVYKRGPVTPRMVITPLIDVVFLLIVFFMLVNHIVAEETVKMIVPELDDPQTSDLGEFERVVVNVAPQRYSVLDRSDHPLQFDGSSRGVKIGLRWYEPSDTEAITDAMRQLKASNPNIEVLLRCDGALYYESIHPVMKAIAEAGIEKLHLVAMSDAAVNTAY